MDASGPRPEKFMSGGLNAGHKISSLLCPVGPGLPREIRLRQRSVFHWGPFRVFNRRTLSLPVRGRTQTSGFVVQKLYIMYAISTTF